VAPANQYLLMLGVAIAALSVVGLTAALRERQKLLHRSKIMSTETV